MDFIAPDLLRTFAAVADHGSFTRAARTLGLRQSTVSQHVRRLEELAGRRLLDRDTHRVGLTPAGEAVLDHARRILELNAALLRHLAGESLRGRLRLGASEDFVLSALPDVLAAFARQHPEVDVELTAGLSAHLYEGYDAGQLDVIIVKRREHDPRGAVLWRDATAWIGRPGLRVATDAPLPLLLYPPPSVSRALALSTLEQHQRTWRIAFTSGSLVGLTAAARSGIGVMPHSVRLAPAGLAPIRDASIPPLPEIEFVVLGPTPARGAAAALIDTILQGTAGGLEPRR